MELWSLLKIELKPPKSQPFCRLQVFQISLSYFIQFSGCFWSNHISPATDFLPLPDLRPSPTCRPSGGQHLRQDGQRPGDRPKPIRHGVGGAPKRRREPPRVFVGGDKKTFETQVGRSDIKNHELRKPTLTLKSRNLFLRGLITLFPLKRCKKSEIAY